MTQDKHEYTLMWATISSPMAARLFLETGNKRNNRLKIV